LTTSTSKVGVMLTLHFNTRETKMLFMFKVPDICTVENIFLAWCHMLRRTLVSTRISRVLNKILSLATLLSLIMVLYRSLESHFHEDPSKMLIELCTHMVPHSRKSTTSETIDLSAMLTWLSTLAATRTARTSSSWL